MTCCASALTSHMFRTANRAHSRTKVSSATESGTVSARGASTAHEATDQRRRGTAAPTKARLLRTVVRSHETSNRGARGWRTCCDDLAYHARVAVAQTGQRGNQVAAVAHIGRALWIASLHDTSAAAPKQLSTGAHLQRRRFNPGGTSVCSSRARPWPWAFGGRQARQELQEQPGALQHSLRCASFA